MLTENVTIRLHPDTAKAICKIWDQYHNQIQKGQRSGLPVDVLAVFALLDTLIKDEETS
jgi:hypothetical protein